MFEAILSEGMQSSPEKAVAVAFENKAGQAIRDVRASVNVNAIMADLRPTHRGMPVYNDLSEALARIEKLITHPE